jgi:hypothetical protein
MNNISNKDSHKAHLKTSADLSQNISNIAIVPAMKLHGSSLRSHRTGRTTQEVEQWTDPEESAKEVRCWGF